jgi:hypothetical protein
VILPQFAGCEDSVHIERNDGMVRLFVKRAVEFLEPEQKIISRNKSVRLRTAPASLENLFLHLTAAKLRMIQNLPVILVLY